jgi:hypothetical protein
MAFAFMLFGLSLFATGLYMAWPPMGVMAFGAAFYYVGLKLYARTANESR